MKTESNKSLFIFFIAITLVACGGGGGGSGDSYDTVYITSVPSPRDVTIENDADGNIVLDWSLVGESAISAMAQRPDTISYNVYWSTSGYPDSENIEDSVNVSKPPFIHKNLSPGTTYYYAISAHYTIGGSWEESNLVGYRLSATAGVPTKPLNLSAESVSSDIQLSWDPAARADTYNVSWSNSLGESGSIDYVTSPFLHTGLVGVGYQYVVTASNAYGNSLGVAVSAYPELPPETPVGLGVIVTTAFDFCFRDLEDCTGFVREDKTVVRVNWRDIGADFQDIGGEYEVFSVSPSGQTFRVATTSNSFYSKKIRLSSAPADSYCYYVVARNNFGMSSPTDTKCGVYF